MNNHNLHKNNKNKGSVKKKHKQRQGNQGLHPNNPHQGRYNLSELCQSLPALVDYVRQNPNGEDTIDFTDPTAVKILNKALLFHHYGLCYWDIPDGFLCPPIPSRADYIHHIADELGLSTNHRSADNNRTQGVRALDIGTGANLIYPIIGVKAYGWRFTATDIDPVSVENAKFIIASNPSLKNKIRIKQQPNPTHIFHGIINKPDWFDVTICNPPFHASLEEAMASNQRKQKKLSANQRKRHAHSASFQSSNNQKGLKKPNNTYKANTSLNFGGQKAELWCDGGEINFLKRMAIESKEFAENVGWFTTLVSKSENIPPLTKQLNKLGIKRLKQIKMTHGQKVTRVLAWGW